MAIKYIGDTVLTNLANTVRAVFNETNKMSLNNMANIIRNKDYEYNTNGLNAGIVIPANVDGNYQDMSNFFNGNSIKGMPFVGNEVINMASAYRECKNLIGYAAFGYNVKNMSYAYAGCTNLKDLPPWIPLPIEKRPYKNMHLEDCSFAFYNTRVGSPLILESFTLNDIYTYTNQQGMFMNTKFTNVGSDFTIGPETIRGYDMSYMYADCENLDYPSFGHCLANAHSMFRNCIFKRGNAAYYTDYDNLFYYSQVLDISYAMYNTKFLSNNYFEYNCYNTYVRNMVSAFENSNITGYALKGCSNVINFENAYRNSGISYAVLSKNMENAYGAYADCKNLIDLIMPIYTNLTNLNNTFSNCPNFCPTTIFIDKNVTDCHYIINNSPAMNNSAITLFGNIFNIDSTGAKNNFTLFNFGIGSYTNNFLHNTRDNIFGIILDDEAVAAFTNITDKKAGIIHLLNNYLLKNTAIRLTDITLSDLPTNTFANKYISVKDPTRPSSASNYSQRFAIKHYITAYKVRDNSAATYTRNCAIGIYYGL